MLNQTKKERAAGVEKNKLQPRRIGIATTDIYTARLIELELGADYACTEYDSTLDYDAVLIDTRYDNAPNETAASCTLRLGEDVPVCFMPGELKSSIDLLFSNRAAVLAAEGRSVFRGGKKVHLSELEFSLLSALYEAKGEFVSRAVLNSQVFSGSADERMLNLYIHYLRGKLEDDGEKLIISSRKLGYRLHGSFFGQY